MTGPHKPVPPSGRQLALHSGEARAVVVELGGGLRRLEVGGRPLVAAYGEDEPVTGGRGQHLAPWPNRLDEGRWSWQGRSLQLPQDDPGRRVAIHGLVRWQPWELVRAEAALAELRTRVLPRSGWPGTLGLSVLWRLDGTGLTCEVTARNEGREAFPFGYGAHPYLSPGPAGSGPGGQVAPGEPLLEEPLVDAAVLEVPAVSRLVLDERGLPVRGPAGEVPLEGSPQDFRVGRTLGATALDDCYRAQGGPARLTGTDGVTVELAAGEGFGWWQVYTGETLAPHLRRRSVAVEPMTCPPDALRSGTDLVVLEPGRRWTGTWSVRRA